MRAIIVTLAALGLAGCISVFPKSDPAQLYRFGVNATPPEGPAAATRVEVLRRPAVFPRAAAGDRILTVSGSESAYIAEARWLSPAPVLFEEALTRVFDANAGPARLVGRQEGRGADNILRIEVRAFEAVYDQGPEAAPRVVVRLRAALLDRGDRDLRGDRMIEVSARASENRVGAIVEAYNKAVSDALGQLVTFVNTTAKAG